jgi:hypothetical protein
MRRFQVVVSPGPGGLERELLEALRTGRTGRDRGVTGCEGEGKFKTWY